MKHKSPKALLVKHSVLERSVKKKMSFSIQTGHQEAVHYAKAKKLERKIFFLREMLCLPD